MTQVQRTQDDTVAPFEDIRIGEELGPFEYVLTQDLVDRYRAAVEDPDALFPNIGVKEYIALGGVRKGRGVIGGINAGQSWDFFNPPRVGKKLTVRGRVADKYIRRDKPWVVVEAWIVDEDGYVIARTRATRMPRTEEVAKKWGG